MGEIGARLADRAFVTSDNPRSEEPPAIVDEIVAGAPEVLAGVVTVAPDRRAAIRRARAKPVTATSSSSPARATSRARSSASAASRSTTAPSRRSCWPSCRAGRGEHMLPRHSRRSPRPRRPLEGGDPRAVVGAVRTDSRRRRAARSSSGCPARTTTATPSPRRRWRPARGRCWSATATAAGLPGDAPRSSSTTRSPRCSAGHRGRRRAGVKVVAITGIDRQDLDQGHPRRAAVARRATSSRRRPISTPRSACR